MSDQLAFEDVWEGIVILAKSLLNARSEKRKEKAWRQFPLEHWVRKRTQPKLEDFHQVPHPGKMEDEKSNEFVEQNLVAI